MKIQLLRPSYSGLSELVRDLQTIESQGWTDAAAVGAGITAGHGAPTSTGTDGTLYIDLDTGNLYSWSSP